VASPENENGWVEEARKSSRRDLENKVAVARRRAGANPGQPELMPSPKLTIPPTAVPVRLTVEMTPEQFALYETLLEKLHKLGSVGSRAEMLLEGMAELVADRTEKAPRGALASGPAYQVHVHQCPDCGGPTVPTSRGELTVGKEFAEAVQCDARVDQPGKRNTSTIPPATRRMVLTRDRHKCRTPGCRHTRFLEVHHIKPRAAGGKNRPENLITLCSACHRLWHAKPEVMAWA